MKNSLSPKLSSTSAHLPYEEKISFYASDAQKNVVSIEPINVHHFFKSSYYLDVNCGA